MIISNVNSGLKAGYSVSGAELTVDVPEVGSLTIDLQEKQRDNKRTIDLSLDRSYDRLIEGTGPWYVSTVVVPGKERELVDTGEVEEGEPVMEEVVLPLDMTKVEMYLWGLPETVSEKIEAAEIEEEESE